MPLLRNILIVANILVAILFFALAAMDWGRRTAWAHGSFRYELAADGLPVDDTETDSNGDVLVKKIPGELARQLQFTTQKDAVEARFKEVQGQANNEGDEAAKKQKLLSILGALATTQTEREAYATMDVPQLEEALNQAFRPAREGKTASGKQISPDQQRAAIAHVLFATYGHESADQQKLLGIIGARGYARAAAQEAATLQEMALRVRQQMANDQHAFEVQHKELVQRIQALAERVADRKAELLHHKSITEKNEVLANSRRAEVKDMETRLATVNSELEKALAEQATLEQDLFETERLLGATKEENLKMEKQIRSRELGR
jgi:hypothetical protein